MLIFRPIFLLFAFLAAFFAWATFSYVDQAMKASGSVISLKRNQVIQSADGGVLLRLAVQEGQQVKRGQLLAELERNRAESSFSEARARQAALTATLTRARAEAAGGTPSFDATVQAFPEILTAQRNLFVEKRRARDADLAVLNSALSMAREELEMNRSLAQQGDVSKLEMLRAQRQVLDLQGRIAATRNKYFQDARMDAAKAEEDLASLAYRSDGLADVVRHTSITSPVDGTVKYLRVTTVGGVLKGGDELMQIAPRNGGLIVEAKVNPADAGGLKAGLPATINISAFDYATFGTLTGHVSLISPDTLVEAGPEGQAISYYRVQIRLDEARDERARELLDHLRPGMQADVEIKTGERSVLTYLLKPILRAFSGALHER